MADCLFCKIVAGEIPSTKVYENDVVYAFRDINPQAPVHILIIPKRHYENMLEMSAVRNGHIVNIMEAAAEIAKAEGIDQSGFRLITNCGSDGAQSVKHVHFHLLGGRPLSVNMA